jgi:HK97 family phage prohead protease
MPPFMIYTQEVADQIRKAFSTLKMADWTDTGVFDVVASTSTTDRHWERVRQDGWELDNYKKNPVILVNHNYRVEAICWKATDVRVENDQLIIKWVFAPNEIGQEMRKLYEAGFLKAVSVGFIVKSRNESDRDEITKQELLECSFIPVPANADALDRLKEFSAKFGIKFTGVPGLDDTEKSAELKAIEELAKTVSSLTEKVGKIETFIADGKAVPQAMSENEKALKEALQAIDRVAGATLGSIKKR